MIDYLFVDYINNVAPAFSSAANNLNDILNNAENIPGKVLWLNI